jgi:hypothetical protein
MEYVQIVNSPSMGNIPNPGEKVENWVLRFRIRSWTRHSGLRSRETMSSQDQNASINSNHGAFLCRPVNCLEKNEKFKACR